MGVANEVKRIPTSSHKAYGTVWIERAGRCSIGRSGERFCKRSSQSPPMGAVMSTTRDLLVMRKPSILRSSSQENNQCYVMWDDQQAPLQVQVLSAVTPVHGARLPCRLPQVPKELVDQSARLAAQELAVFVYPCHDGSPPLSTSPSCHQRLR